MTAPAFTPVESLVAGWARSNVTGLRCVTEVPANLEEVLPLARFVRIGGYDRLGLDFATLDIDYFDLGRENARSGVLVLLSKLRYDMPGALLGSGTITRVTTEVAPHALPWDNTNLRRFGCTVGVVMHSR